MLGPRQNACSFFSVVVIIFDVKNKVLDILCIRLHARREKFFHQVVGPYYLRKLTCQIIIKRLILASEKRPRACWDYGKVVHYATLCMAPFNIQYANVFLAHVCEYF